MRGLSEAAARAELDGFDVSTTTRSLPAGDDRDGEVLTQSLSPGAEAPAGTDIVLEIGEAEAPEPTPEPTPDPPDPPPATTVTTTAPSGTAPAGP